MKKVKIGKQEKVPSRYIPDYLTTNDKLKQKQYLNKSRKDYKKGKYFIRPKIKSYNNRRSNHTKRLQALYKVESAMPNKELSEKSKCSIETLEKIINKGKGAYLSSGSRPNQTPSSWGYARLASSLTGGNAAIVDFSLLEQGCKASSKSLKLAKTLCKKRNKCNLTKKKKK
jgi:CRISPR/Cas system CSM-associated protein Csm4 (group 5 of RAMP superfamily)